MTGYDLKKIIQDSPFMYWSGNNNQIYKSLLEMSDEGYVTSEVRHQETLPSKKIYTVTKAGLDELRTWALAAPETLEIRKPFLVQLAWTGLLSNDDLLSQLSKYENGISGGLAIAREKSKGYAPDRTPREAAVWKLIYENVVSSFEHELDWIDHVREAVEQFDANDYKTDITGTVPGEARGMAYRIIKKSGQQYILFDGAESQIANEQDAIIMITACAESDTNQVLIQSERLSDDFLQLRTGVAGAILQKLETYNITAAVVMDGTRDKGGFKDFFMESNQGNRFRVFENLDKAEEWLLKTDGRK
jgi:DNA-binding PadR family transcriptional regulator